MREYSQTASCCRLLRISVKMEPGQMEALWLLQAGGSEKVQEELLTQAGLFGPTGHDEPVPDWCEIKGVHLLECRQQISAPSGSQYPEKHTERRLSVLVLLLEESDLSFTSAPSFLHL